MSKRWLREHSTDQYVKRARQENYRARSAYKLLEIQKKDQIIRSGMTVVDLGAAPGAWSQVAFELLKKRGTVIAVDKLPIEPLKGVQILQGNLLEDSIQTKLFHLIGDKKVDVVLSDMAPETSGIKMTDQARSLELAELAFGIAEKILKPGGVFLVKIFQGADCDAYAHLLQEHFKTVVVRKPKSSRSRSVEIYLLASGFKN